jgi:HD-GYP domain-containing protein (c-di-GMP phosphodiesterase class II)
LALPNRSPNRTAHRRISRIVAVADVVEAMTSDRPYRKALGTEQVINELRRHSGTQFDPLVAKEAIHLLEGTLASEDVFSDTAADSSNMALQLRINLQTS